MKQKKYDIEPRESNDRYVGANNREIVLYAGNVAEAGVHAKAFLDLSNEFVLMEVGKRGSGKSYSMGALLEGLATQKDETSLSKLKSRKGILLLDPLDVHWTAMYPLQSSGSQEILNQYKLVDDWEGLDVEKINVNIWMPAGKISSHDPTSFQPYYIPVSSLTAADWSQLLRTDLVMEPRGQLINEVFRKVTESGWDDGVNTYPANINYGIQDLIDCINNDSDIASFNPETIRSVIQPLTSFLRLPVFSSTTGTSLSDIIKTDTLSILCLNRLEPDLRTVITSVIVKSMMKERGRAAFLEKRLAFENLASSEKTSLETELGNYIGRSVLVLDEAQILLPASGKTQARSALESYVLEGRNYGLSLWLATQRPSGAISPAAKSQVDIFMIHRLSVKEDIDGMCNSLQSGLPTKIKTSRKEISFQELIRTLNTGQAIISSADTSGSANRAFVVNIRPRVTGHGGKAL